MEASLKGGSDAGTEERGSHRSRIEACQPVWSGWHALGRSCFTHAIGRSYWHACQPFSFGVVPLGLRLDPAPPRPPRSLGGSAGASLKGGFHASHLGPLASEYVARTRAMRA